MVELSEMDIIRMNQLEARLDPKIDEIPETDHQEDIVSLPLFDNDIQENTSNSNNTENDKKVDVTVLCGGILSSLIDNLNLEKSDKNIEDIIVKNSQITISKVPVPEKKIETFRCMMCNAKIRFPPDSDTNVSPRFNRGAKAKYRNHLMSEHNANGRYPGMELLVRTTFEQQFPMDFGKTSLLGSSGLIGNNGFVIPEKYRLPSFSQRLQQRPKAFEPKALMQEEDMEEEEHDNGEVETIKEVGSSKKGGLEITVMPNEAAAAAKEKFIAKKKKISDESKEVPITIESGDDSDGTDESSDEGSESDSSINSVDEEEEEEDDEFKEFKSLELDNTGSGNKRPLPLPASIREDLNMKFRKVAPTINKITGLPFGWKKEVVRRAVGAPGFDIYIRNAAGKVFKTKNDLRKYCALYPNKTMGINPDAVFTSGLNTNSKPVEVDLDDKDDGDVECIDL